MYNIVEGENKMIKETAIFLIGMIFIIIIAAIISNKNKENKVLSDDIVENKEIDNEKIE